MTTNEEQNAVLYNMYAAGGRAIVYNPVYNKITGSVTAAILLAQIAYWFQKSGDAPFYKFEKPCNHEAYRPGDSWCEELGFTRTEFTAARSKFAIKKQSGEEVKELLDSGALVVYWTTVDRRTFYALNVQEMGRRLLYVMQDSCFTIKQESCVTNTEMITEYNKGDEQGTPRADIRDAVFRVCRFTASLAPTSKDDESIDTLLADGWKADDIKDWFGDGGWWYTTFWKGKKGQVPRSIDIATEIGAASKAGSSRVSAQATEAWKAVAAWMKGGPFPNDARSKSAIRALGGEQAFKSVSERDYATLMKKFIDTYEVTK